MGDSLFQRKTEAKPPVTPHDLIEHEVAHLKNRPSVRYGKKTQRRPSLMFAVLGACVLLWLYLMDPIEHAWYKGEAVRAYDYLHAYGTGKEVTELATSGILQPEEIAQLNRGVGSYQDYYSTPQAAAQTARTIVNYMASVKALHAGLYDKLDWIGRIRYELYVRPGIKLPTAWDFLDPGVGN